MTTELFKEAIIEAKKLKEVAEIDARNRVIEAVTPIIKKMIAKESANTQQFLFGEDEVPPELSGNPMMGSASMPPAEMPVDSAASSGMPPIGGDVPNVAPISPSGDLVGMPMPDEEGKITVDFGQLFSMGAGSAPGAGSTGIMGGMGNDKENLATNDSGLGGLPVGSGSPNAPSLDAVGGQIDQGANLNAEIPGTAPGVAGVGPEATPNQTALSPQVPINPEEIEEPTPVIAGESKIIAFQNEVKTLAERIDILYFRGNLSNLVKESVKSKLFTLCEQLDQFVNEGALSNKKARIAENKLEFLFMKLNEAEVADSYKMDKGVHMTSLKEFAAKLFEEDALGPATADKATAHAEKVSGVAPGVDLFKEGENKEDEAAMKEALLDESAPASTAFGDGKKEGTPETKSDKVDDSAALAKKPGAGIVESAPASTAFGDGQKATGAENTSKDVHDPKALADKPGANSILEFDEKELREAATKLRKENLARRIKAIKEAAAAGLKGTVSKEEGLTVPKPKEGDQGSAKPVGGKDPAQENLKECGMVEAPAADAMDMSPEGGAGASDEVELTLSIDVDDLQALLNGATDAFVAEPAGEVPGLQAGEEIEVVDDHEAAGGSDGEGLLLDTEEEEEEPKVETKAPPVAAPVAESKKPVTKNALVENLKAQLNEQKLLTAKSLYVSKFLVREDLTKKQKQKIVGYFDKAKSLAEAKETYAKIKKILESASDSTKMPGSAAKPTTAGSAMMNESAGQTNSDTIERSRWMQLAGIRSKK